MLMTFVGGCADRIILFPSQDRVDPQGAVRREVKGGNGVVEVWVARSPGVAGGREPDAYLVEFTGNATRAEEVASYVAGRWGRHPVEVWAVNYPGYGGSTGPARLRDIPGAALAAFDELRLRAGGRPVFVGGVSLGTAAALHVAAERPVAGVILQNPPPLKQLIMGRYGWVSLWLGAGVVAAGVPGQLDSVSNARRTTAPGVFVLAEQDALVQPKYQQMVVDAYAGEKRVITARGIGHNDPLPELSSRELEAALAWFLSRGAETAGGGAAGD